MANPIVYIETTVIGYLAMRRSRDIQLAAKQLTTAEWWERDRDDYELRISQFVIDECNDGDRAAAAERAVFYAGIPVLDYNEEAESLARELAQSIQLPQKAIVDANHISLSAVHGVEYLLTWNCRHIANPQNRVRIEAVCRGMGYEPPVICTPDELLRSQDG